MAESLAWLTRLHHIFVPIVEFLAIFTNSIVVYLIVTERRQLYTDYQRALIVNCMVDYLCSFLALLLQPQYEVLGSQWIFIVGAPLTYLPKRAQMVAVGFYAFINCFGISTIPIQFLYRKCLICDDKKLSNRVLFLLTSGVALVSLLFVYVFAECFVVSEGTEFKRQMLLDSGLVSATSSLLNAEMHTPPMLLMTSFIFVATVLDYGSIFVWSRQVYCKLNEINHEMSPKTRRLQSHFNRMLAGQLGCILFFACIPGSFMFCLMISHIDILGAGTVISILFVFVPLINPMCTLFLVGQFRQRFFGLVRVVPTSGIQMLSRHMTFSKTPVETIENAQL